MFIKKLSLTDYPKIKILSKSIPYAAYISFSWGGKFYVLGEAEGTSSSEMSVYCSTSP